MSIYIYKKQSIYELLDFQKNFVIISTLKEPARDVFWSHYRSTDQGGSIYINWRVRSLSETGGEGDHWIGKVTLVQICMAFTHNSL